jgi:ABC-type transport system substrate-binding protein
MVPLLLAAQFLAGCSVSPSAGQSQTLRLPFFGAAGIPDPALVSTPSQMFLASLLYSGLVKFSPDLHVIPELAISIPTISNDGRTYTFTVRSDARFAGGRRCTANDVAYSLARALSPGLDSPIARRYLGNIVGAGAVEAGRARRLSGVRVIHRLTLRIRLMQPDADFLEKLATPVAFVVDRRVAGTRPIPARSVRPAGTGPWMVTRRDRNGTLELRRRPHFYGSAMQVKTLVLVPVRAAAAELDLYRKGDLDVASVLAEQIGRLSSHSDFHQAEALDAFYALPRGSGAVALTSNLDRARLIQDATPALTALASIVPPAVPDYISSVPTLDPGSSAANLPRVSLQVAAPRDFALGALSRALYRQWPAAGRGRGTRVRLIHASSLLPDPAVWLRLALSQTRSRWYRSILRRSMELTNDPVTRMSSYSRLENWAIEKALIIPLASSNVAYLIKPRVQGLQVTPVGIMPANDTWTSVSVT